MVSRRPSRLPCLAEPPGSLARRSCIVCNLLCSLFSGGVLLALVSRGCLSFCFFPPFVQWSCMSCLFRLGQEQCSCFVLRRDAHTRRKEQGPCGHCKFSGTRGKCAMPLLRAAARGLHVAKSFALCWAAAPDQRGPLSCIALGAIARGLHMAGTAGGWELLLGSRNFRPPPPRLPTSRSDDCRDCRGL